MGRCVSRGVCRGRISAFKVYLIKEFQRLPKLKLYPHEVTGRGRYETDYPGFSYTDS